MLMKMNQCLRINLNSNKQYFRQIGINNQMRKLKRMRGHMRYLVFNDETYFNFINLEVLTNQYL